MRPIALTVVATLGLGFGLFSLNASRSMGPPSVQAAPAIDCIALQAGVASEFQVFLGQHRRCRASSDCTIARTGCPLGCGGVAVAKDSVREAERLSERLLDRLATQGCGCKYKCAPVFDARCVAGSCSEIPLE
jgi:hypothetical protein